jgi:hypothetical protein
LIDHSARYGELTSQLFTEDTDAASRNCTHRQLGVTGDAELADEKYIEGDTQRASDLNPDRHSAAGKAKNDDVIP